MVVDYERLWNPTQKRNVDDCRHGYFTAWKFYSRAHNAQAGVHPNQRIDLSRARSR